MSIAMTTSLIDGSIAVAGMIGVLVTFMAALKGLEPDQRGSVPGVEVGEVS